VLPDSHRVGFASFHIRASPISDVTRENSSSKHSVSPTFANLSSDNARTRSPVIGVFLVT